MLGKKGLLKLSAFAFLLAFLQSCQLFENDVKDFMEKYTETAAIEVHDFNVGTYEDGSDHLCIASDQDVVVSFYLRNPKKFSLVPSVKFGSLDPSFSRAATRITQKNSSTISLSLPQEFLIPVDEGQNISAEIRLYEPMSGRDFDRYKISLRCNSRPPLIQNATIMNNNNEHFVLAFDMPNEYEVALRHKDLTEIIINGKSYPFTITTHDDPDLEDTEYASYAFDDTVHFKQTMSSNYSSLGKSFTHNNRTSFYYESDDAFVAGDKEYTIVLKDQAGLKSTVKASTKIARLQKPIVKDQQGEELTEGSLIGIPYDESEGSGKITLVPPTLDHEDHPVTGATLHYKVYEATGSRLVVASGTTTAEKTIELPMGTYRVESYATLRNYENSPTSTVLFRFMNNILYVKAGVAIRTGEGTQSKPFGAVSEAIADINTRASNGERRPSYTIFVEGDFASGGYNSIFLSESTGFVDTDELVFKTKSGQPLAKFIQVYIDNSVASPLQKVTLGNINISNPGDNGVTLEKDIELIINGAEITDCNVGVKATTGTVKFLSGSITGRTSDNSGQGLNLTTSTLIMQGGTISNFKTHGISLNNCTDCIISGGTISGSRGLGIYMNNNSKCEITNNAEIINNASTAIHLDNGSELTLSGGTISGNKWYGVFAGQDKATTIKIKGNPVVYDNYKHTDSDHKQNNISLDIDQKIQIIGQLTSGCKIGVSPHDTQLLTDIGSAHTFATGYTNSDAPSKYFLSDQGYNIEKDSSNNLKMINAGSSGPDYNASDYIFNFAADITSVTQNTSQVIAITPGVTRKEGNTTRALTYNSSNKELSSADPNVTLTELQGVKVTWSFELYNSGHFVQSLTPITSGNPDHGQKVQFPAISLPGTYSLKVIATYLGIPHDLDIPITVTAP